MHSIQRMTRRAWLSGVSPAVAEIEPEGLGYRMTLEIAG